MFRTHSEAELMLPPGLAPCGERSWNWIELPIQIPFFFLSFTIEMGEGSLRRRFVFSHIRDIQSLIAESKEELIDLEIGLLSPGYMNGSNSYQFGQVKEIWEARVGHEKMFVMSDGEKFHYHLDEDGLKNPDMKLVVSL